MTADIITIAALKPAIFPLQVGRMTSDRPELCLMDINLLDATVGMKWALCKGWVDRRKH